MAGVGNVEREALLEEIEKLKKQQTDIQHRITLLQAQLELETPAISVESDFNYNCRLETVSGHGLSAQMIQRYSRHLLLPAFGVQGQSKILKSSVLLVGAGGLGSPAALYLASCGIGCLGIIDYDVVEMNNLHRQVIHTEANIGKSKVKSAASACHAINSAVKIVEYTVALSSANALDIVGKYDIVVDATDNVATRYLINDSCVILGKACFRLLTNVVDWAKKLLEEKK